MSRGIIKVLDNRNLGGEEDVSVYPVTSTLAVYDNENKLLEEVLKDSKSKLNSLDAKHTQLLNNYTEFKQKYDSFYNEILNRLTIIKLQVSTLLSYGTIEGNIIEPFDGFTTDEEIAITDGFNNGINGNEILWSTILKTFVSKNNENKYYLEWNTSNRYVSNNNVVFKLYKNGTTVYYYNKDKKDLIEYNIAEDPYNPGLAPENPDINEDGDIID